MAYGRNVIPVASTSVLLVFVSRLILVFDERIMHTGAPMLSGTPYGMIGGYPRNYPRKDDGLN